MLRWTTAFLFAIAVGGTAEGADRTVARPGWHRASVNLPAGLPHRHYNFRTTISYGAPDAPPRPYVQAVYAYETPEVLFTPVYYEPVLYVTPWFVTPLLPDALTFPGYDEMTGSYGDSYVSWWDRLPYACGAYGYC